MDTPLRSGGANRNVAQGPSVTPPNQNPHIVDENTPPNSQQNPYLVDENGRFVRSLRRVPSWPIRSPSGSLLIYGIPPSSIVQRPYPASRAARDAANAPPYQRPLAPVSNARPVFRRSATTLNGLNHPSSSRSAPPVSSARTRVRRLAGFRTPRETPLKESDLYLTEARPADETTITPTTNVASAIISSLTPSCLSAVMSIVTYAFADGSNKIGSALLAAP
ncbi:hypothetical protein B0H13DRAFT_2341596 [Mycena leptocephala]|nr:hypothetical protein B0H13DRAFT_2341596 [Mycena leptocephala]